MARIKVGLKQVEAKARGETINVASVTGDVGNVMAGLKPEERTYIKANPVDVEDWGTLTAIFSDGTKATMECVATGRQPLSDLALAYETIKVNYAGYWAAEEGRRVVL